MTNNSSVIKRLFKLKAPCADCPFMKTGIELSEGRLDGIKQDLMDDNDTPFICHKTRNTDSDDKLDADEEWQYQPNGRESYCYGAMAWLLLQRNQNLVMRMGHAFGYLNLDEMREDAERLRSQMRE